MTREELERLMAPPEKPPILKRHAYKEAFIMSPKLQLRIVQVRTIGDGIAILEALGEGKLMVSTKARGRLAGYFEMAECTIEELRGKSEQEVFELLDDRTDELEKKSKAKRHFGPFL